MFPFVILCFLPALVLGQNDCKVSNLPNKVTIQKSANLTSWVPIAETQFTMEHLSYIRVFCTDVGIYIQSQCKSTIFEPTLDNLDCETATGYDEIPNCRAYWPWATEDYGGLQNDFVLDIDGTRSTKQRTAVYADNKFMIGFSTVPVYFENGTDLVSLIYKNQKQFKISIVKSSSSLATFSIVYPHNTQIDATTVQCSQAKETEKSFFRFGLNNTVLSYRCNNEAVQHFLVGINFQTVEGGFTVANGVGSLIFYRNQWFNAMNDPELPSLMQPESWFSPHFPLKIYNNLISFLLPSLFS